MNNLLRIPVLRLTKHGLPNAIAGVAALTIVVAALTACDGGRSFTPASPSPTAVTVPSATYTLSGVVSVRTPAGLDAVEGVQIREETSGCQATTDRNGFYELSGLLRPSSAVTATKIGYTTVRKTVTVSTDTRVDFEVSSLETQVLFGVVFELAATGQMPIAGVSVYCDSCGSPFGHTFAETDAAGAYSFSWANNGAIPLIVRKDDYRLAADPVGSANGRIVATVEGNTRFDIELVRQ